jgi:hypothetical protein
MLIRLSLLLGKMYDFYFALDVFVYNNNIWVLSSHLCNDLYIYKVSLF